MFTLVAEVNVSLQKSYLINPAACCGCLGFNHPRTDVMFGVTNDRTCNAAGQRKGIAQRIKFQSSVTFSQFMRLFHLFQGRSGMSLSLIHIFSKFKLIFNDPL